MSRFPVPISLHADLLRSLPIGARLPIRRYDRARCTGRDSPDGCCSPSWRGEGIVEDLGQGAEAYLQMWERAEGAPRPRCSTTHTRFTGRGIGRVRLGDGLKRLLERAGQPRDRGGRSWRYCIRHRGKSERQVPVFTPRGKVGLIATTARGQRGLGVRIGMPVRRVGVGEQAGSEDREL